MKTEDQYLKFVRWSNEDNAYVGYCPDLFPWGGVCHGKDEEQTYRQLRDLVREEIDDLVGAGKELPTSATRPMREAVGVYRVDHRPSFLDKINKRARRLGRVRRHH